MIVENESEDEGLSYDYDAAPLSSENSSAETFSRDPNELFEFFLDTYAKIRDRSTNTQLRNDLIEHLWTQAGDNNE